MQTPKRHFNFTDALISLLNYGQLQHGYTITLVAREHYDTVMHEAFGDPSFVADMQKVCNEKLISISEVANDVSYGYIFSFYNPTDYMLKVCIAVRR